MEDAGVPVFFRVPVQSLEVAVTLSRGFEIQSKSSRNLIGTSSFLKYFLPALD